MNTAQIEDQAAQWLVRQDNENWDDADAAALENWLDASPAHRVAYLRLKSVWQRAGRLSVLRGGDLLLQTPMREAIAQTNSLLVSWKRLAASFIVIAVAGAATTAYLLTPRETYETPVGARETVHLADGSVMELNTNTAVRATVNKQERRVVLDRGEAFFQVVHDAARPFTVIAGNRRITDLGTKFSVWRDGDRVQVVVKEGRVQIEDLDKPLKAPPVIAKGDTQVVADAGNTLIATKSPQQVADALGWRQGLLIFNQETLADAAAEFNRYNQRKLVVDGTIGQTRIGGSFQAANVDAFARLLRDGFGFRVDETDEEVRVSQ